MKKCVVGIFFALVLCLAMLPMAAFAEDTVGAAQSSRTVITTVDELMQFAADVNAGAYDGKTDAVVSLESDLDLSGKTWTSIGCADNDANVPHFFSGKFYGNGHTISNLDFSDAYGMIEYESYGFFGYIENAEISGLTVQGSVNATGSRKYSDFGSIVGASNKSTIRDCVSDISFTNSDNYLDGSIGLCGFAMDSTFEHCQSKGSISVTRTDNGVASLNVGGIVGYAGGTSEIRYCVNTADIEVCANSIGGIAGSLGSGNPSITNCYSIGKLTVLGKPSGGNTGGIVGYIYGAPPIKSCYFAGEIDLTKYGVTTPPYKRLGGLVGKVESGTPVFKNNYYTETANVDSCATNGTIAGTAESIDSMKTKEFYDKLTQNGGDGVIFTPAASKQIESLEELGFSSCPVCIAKTQYSFSDDPTKLGAPEHFKITVKNVKISAGAGFIVVLTGDILTMPGLPKSPAAERIDVDENGKITGLF